jgi:Mannose-1-phosphate guanylyltransferase
MVNIVILAGGSGTRLWPSSRSGHPKQFLNLHDSNTMLQNTFLRVKNININESIVICNNDHRFFVAEQIKELDIKADIILEPSGKNTAPAIAIAAMSLPKDSLMLVLSADHLIKNQDAFHKSVSIAIDHAQKDKLVNFGVTTTSANTGYGYIKCGKEIDDAYHIEKFVEKPDQHNAKKFHESKIIFGIAVCLCLKTHFF